MKAELKELRWMFERLAEKTPQEAAEWMCDEQIGAACLKLMDNIDAELKSIAEKERPLTHQSPHIDDHRDAEAWAWWIRRLPLKDGYVVRKMISTQPPHHVYVHHLAQSDFVGAAGEIEE